MTQTRNGENGVVISYKEVYTVGSQHRDMRHDSDDEESGQLPWYSTEP